MIAFNVRMTSCPGIEDLTITLPCNEMLFDTKCVLLI